MKLMRAPSAGDKPDDNDWHVPRGNIVEAAVDRLAEIRSSNRGRKVFARSDMPASRSKRDNGLTRWFGFFKAEPEYAQLFGARIEARERVAGDAVFYQELNPFASAGMDALYGLPDGEGAELGVLVHVEIKKKYPGVYGKYSAGVRKKYAAGVYDPVSALGFLLNVKYMDGVVVKRKAHEGAPTELYMPPEEKALRVVDYAPRL